MDRFPPAIIATLAGLVLTGCGQGKEQLLAQCKFEAIKHNADEHVRVEFLHACMAAESYEPVDHPFCRTMKAPTQCFEAISPWRRFYEELSGV